MFRILLTCLLTLGVGLRATAATEHPAQAKAARSLKKASGVAPARSGKASASTPRATATLRVAELGSPRLAEDHQMSQGQLAPSTPSPVDAQYFAQVDSAEALVLNEFRAANPETAALPAALAITLRRPAAPLGKRRFRTRLVRTGRWGTRREAVESLTCTDTGPLVLALLPATATTPAQVLAGPGYDQAVPLRPLELTQAAVLRLCGDRAVQVRAYAMLYNLRFEQADDVARLLDYYNRIAVVKE